MKDLSRDAAQRGGIARGALALAAIASIGLAAQSAPALAATPEGEVAVTLRAAGKASSRLASQGVKVAATRPAARRAGKLTLPLQRATIGRTALLTHGGTIVFRKGSRRVTFSRLRTSLGTQARISGRTGDEVVTLFRLAPSRIDLDAAGGTVSGSGVTVTLTSAAARVIARRLRLRRLPAGTLGTARVRARLARPAPLSAGSTAPAPAASAPAASSPAAPARTAPAPSEPGPDTEPEPEPEEPLLPAIGATDWRSSHLSGQGSTLWSWIAYVRSFGGTVTGEHGAAAGTPNPQYDFTVNATSTAADGDGGTVVTHQGRIRSVMAAHDIDNAVEDPTIVLPASGTTAKLVADGRSGDRDNPDGPALPFTDEHLLDLDLAGITPTVDGSGNRVWADVPATVASVEAAELLGGAQYDGRPWGSFTIKVPRTDVTGSSAFQMRASWVRYILVSPPPAGTITAGDGTTHAGNGAFTASFTGAWHPTTETGTIAIPGYMRFTKAAHGIDITLRDLRIDVDGADSVVSGEVTKGATNEGRKDLATLDLSDEVVSGDTLSWDDELAAFTADGSAVFGPNYAVGSEFGTFTSLEAQRP